jgi:hypothetical protein
MGRSVLRPYEEFATRTPKDPPFAMLRVNKECLSHARR